MIFQAYCDNIVVLFSIKKVLLNIDSETHGCGWETSYTNSEHQTRILDKHEPVLLQSLLNQTVIRSPVM